jgi:hypothetical protein
MQKRIWRQSRADILEHKARGRFAFHPEIDGRNFVAARDHGFRQIELLVKFERARLNCKRARGGPRLGGLVDDADLDTEPGEPQRKHKTRGARAGNQNLGLRHLLLPMLARKENAAV